MRLAKSFALFSIIIVGGSSLASAQVTYTENYDDGTDVGQWLVANSVPRVVEDTGGNPGKFLQQGGFSTHTPTWGSASPRYQPGFNDTFKIDSIYTGDWYDDGVTSLSADMNIIQPAGWGPDRAITFKLMQMDDTGFSVNFEATYTLPDFDETPPVGWQTYLAPVDARSTTVPAGWVFTDGLGNAGTDAQWAQFMQRIDLTTIGYYKPGFAYVGFGSWTLGIDNISVNTVPEPASLSAIGLAGLTLLRRRRRAEKKRSSSTRG